jgi:glycosyltransferase involved in cell wall biosynthesis
MQEYFDSVHVISTSNRHLLRQDDIDTSAVRIADAKTIDYRTLFQRWGRKSSMVTEKSKTSFFGKTAARLQSSMPTLYLFGEGNWLYIRNAVRAAEKILKANRITHLFSTFPPYSDHLIAAKLKRAHPELYWIADFRDLHVDPAQDNLLWRKYQKKVNQKILHSADVVTTVSEGLASHLRELHPNVQVLPNGVREMSDQSPALFPKFTISYTGSMFQDKRRHETLLAAIKQLIDNGTIKEDSFELLYAGKDSAAWWPLINQFGLNDVFRDHGLIARKDAEIIQQRSHINVLLTYSTDELKGNLTGKLYDYLSARRPLLVLINGPIDTEIENLIERTGAGLVVYHGDVNTTAEYIAKAYMTWTQTRELSQQYHAEAMNNLKWKNILRAFAERNAMSVVLTHA